MQLSSSPSHSERFRLDPAVCPTLIAASSAVEAPRGASPLHAARHLIEPDPNSFASDYSELGEPIREHLAGVQIIGREDLDLGNTIPSDDVDDGREWLADPEKRHLLREDNETDEQFARRVRKINYLSLAQEFAELKRLNADALPFDLHRDEFQTSTTSSGLSTDDDDCDDDDDPVDSEDGGPNSPALTLTSHSDATIPDVIPNQRAAVDEDLDRGDSGDHPPSYTALHNGRSDDVGSSSPRELRKTNSSVDDSSGRTSVNVDQSTTSKITLDSQSRKTAADDAAACGTDDFDVYTIETALPHVEWERIEQSLKMSAGEQKKRWSRCGDRDEIRRRLAMSADDDFYCGASVGGSAEFEFSMQRRGGQSSFHVGGRSMHGSTSLQVCYLNDVAADLDRDSSTAVPTDAAVASGVTQRSHPKPDVIPKSISEASTLSSVHCKVGGESAGHEDFFTKQAQLQAEAKLALAQVRPMAHMQLQIEKEMRKKTSPLSETVVGIPGFVDGKMRQLNHQLLRRMNIAQLQVVVNDLHTQIEALNSDLMQQLVDRDDLHMAQDSMLVDIDDLTRRAQEFAAKINKRNSTAADTGFR